MWFCASWAKPVPSGTFTHRECWRWRQVPNPKCGLQKWSHRAFHWIPWDDLNPCHARWGEWSGKILRSEEILKWTAKRCDWSFAYRKETWNITWIMSILFAGHLPLQRVFKQMIASTLQGVHWHVRLQAWTWTPSSDSDTWSSRGLLVGRWLVGFPFSIKNDAYVPAWCVAQNASQFPCPCAGKILETTFLMRPFKVKALVFSLLQIAKRVSKYPLTLWNKFSASFLFKLKVLVLC